MILEKQLRNIDEIDGHNVGDIFIMVNIGLGLEVWFPKASEHCLELRLRQIHDTSFSSVLDSTLDVNIFNRIFGLNNNTIWIPP